MKKIRSKFVMPERPEPPAYSVADIVRNPANAEEIDRVEKIKKAYHIALGKSMDQINDFFITEISAKTTGAPSAVKSAERIVAELTKGEINSPLTSKFLSMITIAAEVKMATFITKLLELSDKEAALFISVQFQTQGSPDDKIVSALRQLFALSGAGEGPNVLVPKLQGLGRFPQRRGRAEKSNARSQKPRPPSV